MYIHARLQFNYSKLLKEHTALAAGRDALKTQLARAETTIKAWQKWYNM